MEIDPTPGTRDVRLGDGVTGVVERAHDDVARTLGVAAGWAPPAVDAGEATRRITALLGDLAATTGDLARLNRMLAGGVRASARHLADADDAVATGFHLAAREVA